MSEPEERTRLSPWLSRELHKALDERDPETVFMIIGDYLEYQKLRMPADRVADWRARGLFEIEPGTQSGAQ